VSEGPGTYF